MLLIFIDTKYLNCIVHITSKMNVGYNDLHKF